MRPQRGRHASLPHGTAHVREASLSVDLVRAAAVSPTALPSAKPPLCDVLRPMLADTAPGGSSLPERLSVHRSQWPTGSGGQYTAVYGSMTTDRAADHRHVVAAIADRKRHRRRLGPPHLRPPSKEHSSESQSRHVDRVSTEDPGRVLEPARARARTAQRWLAAVLRWRSDRDGMGIGDDGDWGQPATAPW